MIDKQILLKKYIEKEDKLFASSIIDKIIKFEKTNSLIYTNFLNVHELKISKEILNKCNIPFQIFDLNENIEKRCIALVPDYIDKVDFECVKLIEVKPTVNNVLKHKDYMGSIYNIGIKEELIGDIIVFEDRAYIFLIDKILDFILLNYTKVGNTKVSLNLLNEESYSKITQNFEELSIIVPSLRIDSILAHVYKLSRNEVNDKIDKSELYINSICITNKTYILKENDIVAFRRCGKFKYINTIKQTKTGNIVIKINVYK